MTYQDRLKWHLSSYKEVVQNVSSSGSWTNPVTSKKRHYSHILPDSQQRKNIISPYRPRFWQDFDSGNLGKGVKLHRDFAHLNSSQAMCFNLFYPAIADSEWAKALVAAVLGLKSEKPKLFEFERIEDPKENTNFDFYCELVGGGKIYFELKLSEKRFSHAKNDAQHRKKLRNIYRPMLEHLVAAEWLEETKFFSNYQVLRNIAYIKTKEDKLFFIFPKANESIRKAAEVIPRILSDRLAGRVTVLFLEDLYDRILSTLPGGPSNLRDLYEEFGRKYMLRSM